MTKTLLICDANCPWRIALDTVAFMHLSTFFLPFQFYLSDLAESKRQPWVKSENVIFEVGVDVKYWRPLLCQWWIDKERMAQSEVNEEQWRALGIKQPQPSPPCRRGMCWLAERERQERKEVGNIIRAGRSKRPRGRKSNNCHITSNHFTVDCGCVWTESCRGDETQSFYHFKQHWHSKEGSKKLL